MEMNKALPMRPDKTNFSHYNLKVKKLQVDLLFLLPRITDTIPDIPTVTKKTEDIHLTLWKYP